MSTVSDSCCLLDVAQRNVVDDRIAAFSEIKRFGVDLHRGATNGAVVPWNGVASYRGE